METKSFETKKNTFENTFNPFVTETKKQMESSVPNMQNPFQYPLGGNSNLNGSWGESKTESKFSFTPSSGNSMSLSFGTSSGFGVTTKVSTTIKKSPINGRKTVSVLGKKDTTSSIFPSFGAFGGATFGGATSSRKTVLPCFGGTKTSENNMPFVFTKPDNNKNNNNKVSFDPFKSDKPLFGILSSCEKSFEFGRELLVNNAHKKVGKWLHSIHSKRNHLKMIMQKEALNILRSSRIFIRQVKRYSMYKIKMLASTLLTIQISANKIRRRSMAKKIQRMARTSIREAIRHRAATILCRFCRTAPYIKSLHKQKDEHENLISERNELLLQMRRAGHATPLYSIGQQVTTLDHGYMGEISSVTDNSYAVTNAVGISQSYSESAIELASARGDLSPLLDIAFDDLVGDGLETKQHMLLRASTSLNPLRRATSRRQRIVQECVAELALIWFQETPKEKMLTTSFEKNTAMYVATKTRATLETVSEQILKDTGFHLDVYEDKIEYWKKNWINLKQCSLCCFLIPTQDLGFGQQLEEQEYTKKQQHECCDHGADFCRDCLQQYFIYQMKDGLGKDIPMTGITCPKQCKTPVLDKTVETLLGKEIYAPLAKKMNAKRINARPNLRFCPNSGCGMEISVIGTKLRLLYSPQRSAAGSYSQSLYSSKPSDFKWYSVSVRELIPGKIDSYRIEFENETMNDVVMELEHIPQMNTGMNSNNNIVSVASFPSLVNASTSRNRLALPKSYYYFENENDEQERKLPKTGAKYLPQEIVMEAPLAKPKVFGAPQMPTKVVLYKIMNVLTQPDNEAEVVYLVQQISNDNTLSAGPMLKKESNLKVIDYVYQQNIEMFNALHERKPMSHCSDGKCITMNNIAVVDTSFGNDQCWQCSRSLCVHCGAQEHDGSCNGAADDALSALANDREKFVQCPKCMGVLERIAGCDHMTCQGASGLGCSAEFCFQCLSMPHCGPECKKPKKAATLRQKWRKERDEREKQLRIKHQKKQEETKEEETKEETKDID
jgi:hypothetical protein